MTDEKTPPDLGDASDPAAPTGGDAGAGWRVLDEQQARIAALRAAVLSGRVPEDGAFDYEAFFASRREAGTPTS